MINPDNFTYVFGGDGAYIYFNMIYHVLYGDGLMLSNMNHPVGESILLTDAQASVTYLMGIFRDWDWVRNNILGITHSIHFITLFAAILFCYYTFQYLNVNSFLAVVFSILIIFLCPQLIRLKYGHFGLAYPIVFTSTIYWIVSFKNAIPWTKSILAFLLLFFFGFNNIYLLIIGCGFLGLATLFHYIYHRNKNILIYIISACLPIILVYALLKSSDPGMDRVVIQWGHEYNFAKFKSIVYPSYSLLGDIMNTQLKNAERVSNIGLVNTIIIFILLGGLFSSASRKLLGKTYKGSNLIILLMATLPLLAYACGAFSFVNKINPELSMFKASGRFAWPFYYALCFVSIYLIDRLSKSIKHNKVAYLSFIIVPFIIWGCESNIYLNKHVAFNLAHNHYKSTEIQRLHQKLVSQNIYPQDYQAIYTLPVIVGWNDKIQLDSPFNTEYSAMLTSMSTGLPLINGKYSRLGTERALQIIQFVSHPVFNKEGLNELTDKAILLIVGNDDELSNGERYLLEKANYVGEINKAKLYAVSPSDMDITYNIVCPTQDPKYWHKSFDHINSDQVLAGTGSLSLNSDSIIWTINTSLDTSLHELSFYDFTSSQKFGSTEFELSEFNDAELINTQLYKISQSKDVVGRWRRGSILFTPNNSTNKLVLKTKNINQLSFIDELHLQRVIDTSCIQTNNGTLFNNYLVIPDTE